MSRPRKDKGRQLAVAGALVSLAGLSYYLYQSFSGGGSSSSNGTRDGGDGRRTGETSKNGKQRYTATLSLSLPPTFIRNNENMTLLKQLLESLSQAYQITLIAPPPLPAKLSSSSSSAAASPTPSDGAIGSGVETVAQLSQSLSDIPNFDSRRVLEYSREEGRLALARALACDAHCEVMIDVLRAKADETSGDDGDVTPRAATTPRLSASSSFNSVTHDDDQISQLEQYHSDMARIRKSSSLLIFLILPTAAPSSYFAEGETTATTSGFSVSHLAIETVIQPFLLPGQQEMSSRVPGVKIIDGRDRGGAAGGGLEQAWKRAAQRVTSMSKGWQ